MFRLAIITLGVCFLGACGDSSDSTPSATSTPPATSTPSVTSTPDGSNTGYPTLLPTVDLTGTFKYFGYIDIIDDTVEDRVNRGSNFLEMVDAQDASVFVNSVPPAIDTCKLRITPSIPTDVGAIGFPNAQFNFVSAGDTFTLTSDAGIYATVNYSDRRFKIAPYPVPDNLTLDIPGQVFPAFNGITVPTVVKVKNFKPRYKQPLTADTPITWDSTGISGHSIYLKVFDIFASDKVVDLYCRMADDGSFALPADIVTALNSSLGAGFELDGAKQDVVSMNVIVQGDAFLVVSKRQDFLR